MARKKRDAPISFRPPAALREDFAQRVANSGLSVNAFIAAAVFGSAAPKPRRKGGPDQRLLASLLLEAAVISDRLPGLTGTTPVEQKEALEACRADLIEIRTCLMRLLGRDP